jgi:ubiquitin-protein ligase E3 D
MRSALLYGDLIHVIQEDLLPSIGQVQSICITTLNDLLSVSRQWSPIVPDRRHSMPHPSHVTPGSSSSAQRSSALQTLVTNLRLQDANGEMTETSNSLSEGELLQELRSRVERASTTLSPREAELSQTLVSLLFHFHRLSFISPLSPSSSSSSSNPRVVSYDSTSARNPSDPYSTLRRQVSDFQLERSWSHTRVPSMNDITAASSVEASLLWSLIDDELEAVLNLCRSHSDPFADHLPPDYEDADGLPDYEPAAFSDVDVDVKSLHKPSNELADASGKLSDVSEKMKMDLEAVTMAIDRLYLVAPQLHNQRVELNKSKLEQMEKARRKGKQRPDGEIQMQELDRMLKLIDKASERKLTDQAVFLDGNAMREKIARASQKDLEKVRTVSSSLLVTMRLISVKMSQRAAFVEQLAKHSDAGRLHAQDAVFSTTSAIRVRSHPNLTEGLDPHALLTLPEFIREGVPEAVQRRMTIERDPEALLTLPEFIKENPPPELLRPSSIRQSRGISVSYSSVMHQPDESSSPIAAPTATRVKGSRSRSMSEPLSWFLPKSSSPTQGSGRKSSTKKLSRQGSVRESAPEVQGKRFSMSTNKILMF